VGGFIIIKAIWDTLREQYINYDDASCSYDK
jgi:hypothetical protein